MAVVVITRPEGVNEQMYDAVQEKLGDEMPAGMIVHTSGRNADAAFQIVDVWESREAHERFVKDRLAPAINALMRDMGRDEVQGPPRDETIYEAHSLMGEAVAAAR
jgi:hypothetical protein